MKNKKPVVRNYIESPSETLAENDIMLAKAKEKANSNGWAQGLSILGTAAVQYGMSQMGAGSASGGITGAFQEPDNGGMQGTQGFGDTTGMFNMGFGDTEEGYSMNNNILYAAFGGKVKGKVEVEGDEVAELPDDGLIEFEGPSHEEGGIKTMLPAGTDIFSKRITVDGKTMAERQKARTKKVMSLEKLLKDNEMDPTLKATLKRTKSNNAMEQEKDKRLQTVVKLMKEMSSMDKEGNPVKFADGGTVMGDIFSGLFGGEEGTTGMTGGDLVGLAGTLYSAFAPMNNTNKNRAGDTPNINAFKDFGNDALDRVDEAKGFIQGQQDKALMDVEVDRTRASKSNRNSARGVNTARALDLATDVQVSDAKGNIYDTFAKQMIGLLTQQAGLENEQDTKVMAGEATRDDNDRRDRDNYYSQLAKDIGTKGQGIQQVGKMLNQNKKNNVSENLLNNTSKNYKVDTDGNIILKSGKKELSIEESLAVANAYGYDTIEDYIASLNQD